MRPLIGVVIHTVLVVALQPASHAPPLQVLLGVGRWSDPNDTPLRTVQLEA